LGNALPIRLPEPAATINAMADFCVIGPRLARFGPFL
jgi:hypothetical protein